MNSLLVLIYLCLGCQWVNTNTIYKSPTWLELICNFIFWPICLLISMVFYKKEGLNILSGRDDRSSLLNI